MVIPLKKKADELNISTPDLITRPAGRAMYESIQKLIQNIQDEEVVILDFDGIKVIDSSFIDELIVRLIKESRTSAPSYFIKLKNMSQIAEINIDLVFKSYSNYKNEKIVVMADDIRLNNSFFIGPLLDKEKDIIEYLRVNRTAPLEDLQKFSGLSADEIKNIMGNLSLLRIVRDDGAGFFSTL